MRRTKQLALYAAIRRGVQDAKNDIEFTTELGYPPIRWSPTFSTPRESELYARAYERTLVMTIARALERIGQKANKILGL